LQQYQLPIINYQLSIINYQLSEVSMNRHLFILTVSLFITIGGLLPMIASAAEESQEFNGLRLPFGPADKRLEFVKVPVNAIVSTEENHEITASEMFSKLAQADVILVGEGHTSEQHHQVQKRVVEGLIRQGRRVVLALEMFNPRQNPALSDYVSGKFDDADFMEKAGWFKSWGHNFRYYQPIFSLAKRHHIPLCGINIPSDLMTKVKKSGIASLTPEERELVAEPDTGNAEHRFYVNTMMQGVGAEAPALFPNLYFAHCLWDAAMGEGAIKVAKAHPKAKVVLLAGTGHVAYHLGIARIISQRSGLKTAVVMPVDVRLPKKTDKNPFEAHLGPNPEKPATPTVIVSRGLGEFLVGVPEEEFEKYPTFGMSLKDTPEGIKVSIVLPDSIAEKRGFKNGDLIVEFNGQRFADTTALRQWLTWINWGDKLVVKVRRAGRTRRLAFTLTPPVSK